MEMNTSGPKIGQPEFLKEAGQILNSGRSRVLLLTGNLFDVFPIQEKGVTEYQPLTRFLVENWNLPGFMLLVHELNGPIRFLKKSDQQELENAWLRWKMGWDENETDIQKMFDHKGVEERLASAKGRLDELLLKAVGNPTLGLELLRQFCLCSRTSIGNRPLLSRQLIIVIESADLLIPDAPVASMGDSDRRRLGICQDWFSDPGFVAGEDSVVLLSEARAQIHSRISGLPQVAEVKIPSPDINDRIRLIEESNQSRETKIVDDPKLVGELSAGLSLHALRQMLKVCEHENVAVTPARVFAEVESFIHSQLGEDMVELKKPTHSLKDVVGFSQLKQFFGDELIPRLKKGGDQAPVGSVVCGPVGSGKSFVFEGLASELDSLVLVIKSIRSQWFGQTDVLFERLKRVLTELSRVVVFIDEADTQFGGVDANTHDTERRLTGRLQSMMSDPSLRGRVFWLLITARVHLLSPDLRRPGRAGDFVIPVLDPEDEDRDGFVRWAIKPALCDRELSIEEFDELRRLTAQHSAAAFASSRSDLLARRFLLDRDLSVDEISGVIRDRLPPAITPTREYQTLQALANCSHRSLLPEPEVSDAQREEWVRDLRLMESKGIH